MTELYEKAAGLKGPGKINMEYRRWAAAAALLALAGCQSDSSTSQAKATPAGTGIPLIPANQSPFCIGQVSSQYGIRPENITTSAPVTTPDGTILIDGIGDQEAEVKKAFRCRFDAQGRFIDARATTSGGVL